MHPDRRAFVLPTTLMVMTLLTVLLSAAFVLVSAEFRATDNTLASQRALAIAQAGLQNYLSRNPWLGTGYDSAASIPFSNGYASVAASRVLSSASGSNAVWVLRSYGYVTDRRLTGTVAARRVIATLANVNPGALPAQGALTAMNPVMIQGVAGVHPIQGTPDDCVAAGRDSIALMVPSGAYQQPPPGSNPAGGIRYLASPAEVYDSTHIDWAALLTGNFSADYDITGGVWPPMPSAFYPVYYASGDLYFTDQGVRSGVLVVRGNLRIGANARFNGVVIVGGTIESDQTGGNGVLFYFRGAVIGGLNNAIAPGSVGTSHLRRSGAANIIWNSCNVRNAAAAMSYLAPIPGTWTDNWSLY